MQGQQQTVGASSVAGSSTNSTAVNASATGVQSVTTSAGNEKPLTPTNHSSNTPPPSVLPTGTTTDATAPGENDAMNSLDEQTAASGDSINKDHS